MAKRDWLETYVDFTKDFEAPAPFALWTGILTLSVAAGHRVWLKEANNKVWPNLYVVLVGPSGVGKGQAMREALPFLDKTLVPRSPDMVTLQRMVEHMSECQQYTKTGVEITPYCIWAEELPSFLGLDAWKSGKLADLTNLFDVPPPEKPFRSETKKNGRYEIWNPYVCMLAGCTPSGIYETLPPASVGQGFTSRIIFVWADKYTKRVPIKPWTPEHIRLNNELLEGIEEISKVEGEMEMDMFAQTMWSDYYRFRDDPVVTYSDQRLQGFAARLPFYVKKLAVLLKLSERSPGMEIEVHHIERALGLLQPVVDGLKHIYTEIAPSNVRRYLHRVIKFMMEKGGTQVSHTDIMRKFSHELDRKELQEVIQSLIELGGIVEQHEVTQGRVKRLYSLSRKVLEVL